MKIKIAFIALLSLIISVNSALATESFEKIYSENLNARGGDSIVSSLKSYIITGELIRDDTVHFNFRGAYKAPGKFLIEYYTGGDTLAIGYDGYSEVGWVIMPSLNFNTIELPKEKVDESFKVTLFPIIEYFNKLDEYKAQNRKVMVVDNKDSIYNIPNYRLVCQGNGSEAEIIFVNKNNYLISQINTSFTVSGYTQPAIVSLYDYRNIDNLTIPHHIKVYNSVTSISDITVETVDVNPPLEDIIFEVPRFPDDERNKN